MSLVVFRVLCPGEWLEFLLGIHVPGSESTTDDVRPSYAWSTSRLISAVCSSIEVEDESGGSLSGQAK